MNGWPKTHDSVGNTVKGVQLALIDGAGSFAGVQVAGVWTFTGDAYGIQLAPVNIAKRTHGLQIGIVNRVVSGGLQIGLLNWNQHGLLPVMPLFNIGFE